MTRRSIQSRKQPRTDPCARHTSVTDLMQPKVLMVNNTTFTLALDLPFCCLTMHTNDLSLTKFLTRPMYSQLQQASNVQHLNVHGSRVLELQGVRDS